MKNVILVNGKNPDMNKVAEATKKSLEGRVFTSTKVVCIETGEVFESATCASLHLGLGPSAVRKSIFRNGACAGFHWKYLEADA